MRIITLAISAAICLTALNGYCQQKTDGQDLQKKYKLVNRVITTGTSTESIHLNEVEGVGIAWITGKEFNYGTIEFDVKGKNVLQKSFIGIAFHGLNDSTYEAVYFRPFNFQSTDPARKAHAVQYIANPLYDWPRLRADYPNKYEQPVSPAPDPNDWFHVQIKVEPKTISVFVNNNANPALVVEPLVPLAGKKIGFWAGNNSGGDWKNLTVTSETR